MTPEQLPLVWPPQRPRFDSFAEAQRFVQDNRRSGVVCPCCGQFAKVYKRKLHSGMAAALCKIWRVARTWADPFTPFHLGEVLMDSHQLIADSAKLRFWGLIKAVDTSRWRLTYTGVAFAKHEVSVPRHALLYNDELLQLIDDESIDVRQALGDRFDYEELMRS
jgi:hypothetical protein